MQDATQLKSAPEPRRRTTALLLAKTINDCKLFFANIYIGHFATTVVSLPISLLATSAVAQLNRLCRHRENWCCCSGAFFLLSALNGLAYTVKATTELREGGRGRSVDICLQA